MLKKMVLQFIFATSVIVFAGALLMLGMMVAHAQPADMNRSAPMRPEELARALGLSAEQTVSFQNILDGQRKAMEALQEAIRPQRDAIRESTHQKLAKVMSASQLAAFEKWQQENRPPRPDGSGPGGPNKPSQADTPSPSKRSQ